MLDPNIQGVRRLQILAAAALVQMWEALPDHLRENGTPVPVLLAVPEHRPGFTAAEEGLLRTELERSVPKRLSLHIAQRGHAGALHAIGLASDMIMAGKAEVLLVGGVESYFDPDTLEWLAANNQLAGVGSRSPFLPGEGACFLALMTPRMSKHCHLPPLAWVRGAHSAYETGLIKTDAVNQGKALTAAISQAAAGLYVPDEAVDMTWCDLNGERYRTDEWSYALLRCPEVFRQGHGQTVAYETAVDSWGDVGAASGALLAMLAVRSWQHSYARGPRALVFAGSEAGLRSAVVLEDGALTESVVGR
ncbi:MAG: hypothetical protein ABJA82_11190 [Myxococcales bacterium]